MGARRIPRPQTGTPTSADEIFRWLRYLCLDSDCRGLAGYELEECAELLDLAAVRSRAEHDGSGARAAALRRLLRETYSRPLEERRPSGDPDKATLHLLGVTPAGAKQPRPLRRQLAAEAMAMALGTFQKRYEQRLLRDVAHHLWTLEIRARTGRM